MTISMRPRSQVMTSRYQVMRCSTSRMLPISEEDLGPAVRRGVLLGEGLEVEVIEARAGVDQARISSRHHAAEVDRGSDGRQVIVHHEARHVRRGRGRRSSRSCSSAHWRSRTRIPRRAAGVAGISSTPFHSTVSPGMRWTASGGCRRPPSGMSESLSPTRMRLDGIEVIGDRDDVSPRGSSVTNSRPRARAGCSPVSDDHCRRVAVVKCAGREHRANLLQKYPNTVILAMKKTCHWTSTSVATSGADAPRVGAQLAEQESASRPWKGAHNTQPTTAHDRDPDHRVVISSAGEVVRAEAALHQHAHHAMPPSSTLSITLIAISRRRTATSPRTSRIPAEFFIARRRADACEPVAACPR